MISFQVCTFTNTSDCTSLEVNVVNGKKVYFNVGEVKLDFDFHLPVR